MTDEELQAALIATNRNGRIEVMPSGCWEWRGGLNSAGYGKTGYGKLIHRVAVELASGPIPDGMFVLHACDNPPCCNPAHLRVGTSSDNRRDAVARGRAKGGYAVAKLTPEQVRLVRERHAAGTSMYRLARDFSMSDTNIAKIVHRETWKNVA